MGKYNKRVFGSVIVKAINSNYNADFSGQPRTLPNGKVYATDKALKYAIKNYIKDIYTSEKVFYFKRLSNEFIPYSLEEAYEKMFPENKETKDKKVVTKDILSCIDIRLFGATFAKKGKNNIAISIHGPVQINHGVNIWKEDNIFTEQIMSPFRNPDEKSEEKEATTLGRQSKLQEGHYVHHFSINPQNLQDITILAGAGTDELSDEDINKLKEAMRRGVTYYDSAAKAGSENEILVWTELVEGSKLVIPNFTSLIKIIDEREDGKAVFDFKALTDVLTKSDTEIGKIEIYSNQATTKIENKPTSKCNTFEL
ncbi:MAG: type I CRISPR-associated protein Cas7 [Bacteroidales bacterium]|nr:type I CRISPR-associated protein Cas7 [Bacteroidales bacterium]